MVDILLATFNGEKFLRNQLNSLFSQTYSDFHLFVRDDGSSDKTVEILNDFYNEYPNKIFIITDNKGNLGPSRNFGEILHYAQAPYIMFCDQDDIWLPQKIELTLKKMKTMESKYGKKNPLLIHTDLKVANLKLDILSDSFWSYHNINSNSISTNFLLIQNVVTGCTMMINKPLRSLINQIPKEAKMHDYWITLVSSVFGNIEKIDKPMVLYRQHDRNTIGTQKWPFSLFKKLPWNSIKKHNKGLEALLNQARAFLDIYGEDISERQYDILSQFANLKSKGFFRKRYLLVKYKFYRTGFIRNFALFLLI